LPLYTKDGRSVFYVHVPKTGGTAIEAFFNQNGFRVEYFDTGGPQSLNRYRRCAPQHMHAAQIMMLLRPARFDYLFMTVREPLRRLVSEYKMRVRTVGDAPSLTQWFERISKQYVEDNYVAENHIRPQSEFWLPTCEVYKQEDGFGDILVGRLEERLGMTFSQRRVGMYNDDETTLVDAAEIKRVRPLVLRFYRQDYLNFGYSPEKI
jgi:hypothetical protein